MTRVAGKAIGRSQRAERLINDIERRFADVRREHPEFARQQAVVVDAGDARVSYYPYSSEDPRGQFLTALGFQPAPSIDAVIGNAFGTQISAERVDLLDIDRLILLINPAETEQLEQDPLFQGLEVFQDDRVVYLPYDQADKTGAALSFNSALSIPYGIDHLIPRLERS